MQRVVRLSFIGLLAMAGLTACGDKVEVAGTTTTPPSLVVRSVTVTPSSATLNQGDKITLAASVNADAGVTDRTVTWRSGNTAIASVDANGVVTAGTTAGTTTITALAKADTTVRGAAVITVNAAGGGAGGAPATITVSTINQTVCAVGGSCSSVPANLGNVTGQIDVTFNVDPGAQRLVGVDLVLNCTGNGNSGQDTVVASQTLASSNVVDAAAASAPVTLSFNTATFNGTTGAAAFRNGACTIKGRARTNATAGGAITTVTSTSQNITLNNTDVVIGSVSTTKSAIHPVTGLLWNGGDVTITSTPVFYSGRVPATTVITFACRSVTVTGSGTKTATFVDANDAPAVPAPCGTGALPANGNATPAANDIDNTTLAAAAPTFTLVDAAGQPFTNPAATCGAANFCTSASVLAGAPVAVATIRLDTQAPPAGNFALASNTLQNTSAGGYLGTSFRFVADSAAGFKGPNTNSAVDVTNAATIAATTCAGAVNNVNPVTCNLDRGGVDNVTVVFLSATSFSGTFSALTNVSALSETSTGTGRTAIQITTDALGNADTSLVEAAGVPQALRTVVANGGLPGGTTTRFGVDKTAPILTKVAGPAVNDTSRAVSGTGAYVFSITDALSASPVSLVAVVRQQARLSTSSTLPAENTVFGNGTENVNSTAAGCVIGRFNATAAAAGANALSVTANDGTVVGFCTPTRYTLAGAGGGNVQISANFTSGGYAAQGYTTTRVIAIDAAGNQAAPFTNTVVEDSSNPTAGPGVDLPQSISGGSSPAFPTTAADSLDIMGSMVQLNYCGALVANACPNTGVNMILQYPTIAGPGVAFDAVLTRSATVNPTVNFFARSLQNNTGARPASPNPATTIASTVNVGVTDEVGRAGQTGAIALAPAVSILTATPSTNPWSANFNGGTTIALATGASATISVCSSCTAVNPTSTTVTVTAKGVTAVFTNPFSVVQMWYQVNGAGSWFYAGDASAPVSRDDGTNRFFDYSFTWTPPKAAPTDPATGNQVRLDNGANIALRAIGLSSGGDGVVTASLALTFTNP